MDARLIKRLFRWIKRLIARVVLLLVLCVLLIGGIVVYQGYDMYKEAVEHLRGIPEVVECSFTTGPYSILAKMYAQDNEQLMELLNNRIQSIPGVVSTETMIVLDSSIKRNLPME